MRIATNELLALWRRGSDRLDARCAGLGDVEFFWRPAPEVWTVKQSPAGDWTYDYEWPTPQPSPVTTIAWRLVHLAANNWIYWDWAAGSASRTFPDLDVPHTAAAALANWRASCDPIRSWLEIADDSQLSDTHDSHLGGTKSLGDVLVILIDELCHHGAEVALLRDLYAHSR